MRVHNVKQDSHTKLVSLVDEAFEILRSALTCQLPTNALSLTIARRCCEEAGHLIAKGWGACERRTTETAREYNNLHA